MLPSPNNGGDETRVGSIKSDIDNAGQPVVSESSKRPRRTSTMMSRWRAHAAQNITHDDATLPLAWQALLTGMIDALLYSRCTIWTGFQTGNMVQFSQNIAQYMLPQAERFPLETLERAVSVMSFIVGSFIGGKLSARFGASTRGWLAFSAVLQSLLLWGAAGILLSLPADVEPSFQYFPPIIMFSAMSMGLQSVTAQKLASPAFATTVAFTATLTQIASDPFLFHLGLAPIEQFRQRTRKRQNSIEGQSSLGDKVKAVLQKPKTLGRERRIFGIFSLCVGAGIAECLLYSKANLRGAMAIAAGFRLVQALFWLFATPKDAPKPRQIVPEPASQVSNPEVKTEAAARKNGNI